MKDKKEINTKNTKNTILEDAEQELYKARKNKNKKKKIITIIVIILLAVIMGTVGVYEYFYGNKGYLRADIKLSCSSKLYENSEPQDVEDIGEGALFIIFIDGIIKEDFLDEYEVMEITINEEQVNLETVTYKHLNKALSIRMHSKNYKLEEGNVVVISIKDKSSGQIITKRLYHNTEIV